MSLDTATVRRIARLARIHLDDTQVPQIEMELNGILSWIEQLAEVDVDGVAPFSGNARTAALLRPDVVSDGGIPEAILSNAPDRVDNYFAVPKVVE